MFRPVLISVAVFVSAAPAFAEVKRVAAGQDLQAVLNAARPGDEIRLQAGATFAGNFVLPAIAGSSFITLRSDIPDSALPAANQRVTPAAAVPFAKIVSPNTASALRTAPGAHHWKVMCLEFPNTKNGFGDIVQLGDGSSAQSSLAQVPRDLIIDRVYIHGDPVLGQKRGIALNSASTAIRNSYISDIKTVGSDSQAIGGWNGPGPYSIENNYLEAAAEVFLLGGADPGIPNLVPSDVLIRFNHMSRPMSWKGSQWQIKNIFELKNARRVRVEYNLFENNWLAAQPGYAILLTPRNQDGRCSWCVVEDIDFNYNVVRNSSAGLNILGRDSPGPSLQTNNIRIRGNVFYGITTSLGGNGWGVLIGEGPRNVIFDHNTFEIDGTTILYAYGSPPIEGFQFINNAAPHRQYGINGAGASTGTLTLQNYFPGSVVTGNWLSGGPSARYPPGNRFDTPFQAGLTTASGTVVVPGADSRPAGADVERMRALVDTIPRGLMPGLPQSPKNLRSISIKK